MSFIFRILCSQVYVQSAALVFRVSICTSSQHHLCREKVKNSIFFHNFPTFLLTFYVLPVLVALMVSLSSGCLWFCHISGKELKNRHWRRFFSDFHKFFLMFFEYLRSFIRSFDLKGFKVLRKKYIFLVMSSRILILVKFSQIYEGSRF